MPLSGCILTWLMTTEKLFNQSNFAQEHFLWLPITFFSPFSAICDGQGRKRVFEAAQITQNCTMLPPTLRESQLLWHLKINFGLISPTLLVARKEHFVKIFTLKFHWPKQPGRWTNQPTNQAPKIRKNAKFIPFLMRSQRFRQGLCDNGREG